MGGEGEFEKMCLGECTKIPQGLTNPPGGVEISLPQILHGLTDLASVPTFSFPFVLDCNQFYELMVAQGEGRSPMTSSDAETDTQPITIIIIINFTIFQ